MLSIIALSNKKPNANDSFRKTQLIWHPRIPAIISDMLHRLRIRVAHFRKSFAHDLSVGNYVPFCLLIPIKHKILMKHDF